jgi:hypothetical protein
MSETFSPEFALTAACCRWPATERQRESINAAVPRVTDWDRYLRVVGRHRTAGLAYHALTYFETSVPGEVIRSLRESANAITRQNLLLAAETIRLQEAFDKAGIPVVFFKGVSLALLAYGTLSLKHGKDIDFCVPPDLALQALRLLEERDYMLWLPAATLDQVQREAMVRHDMEASLIHRTTGVQVELHWALAHNPVLLRDIDVYSETQVVAVSAGRSIRTLANENLFRYLCVHGANHAWSRLKWLADLNAFLSSKSLAEIEWLYRRAVVYGPDLCVKQGLHLCKDLLGRELPENIATSPHDNSRVRRLVAFSLDSMSGQNEVTEPWDHPFPDYRIVLYRFLLSRSWRYIWEQCRFLSVSFYDILHVPLPRTLYFAYPFLRMPLWLWRRLRDGGRDSAFPPLPKG